MVNTQGRMRALALGVTTVMLLVACQGTPASPTPGASPTGGTPAPTGATPTGTGTAPTGSAPTGSPTATGTPPVTASPEPSLEGGTLFMLMSTAVANGGAGFQDLDPQRTYTGEDLAFLGATINRTLNGYVYSEDPAEANVLVADAATDTGTANADATSWTFTIRDGIKW